METQVLMMKKVMEMKTLRIKKKALSEDEKTRVSGYIFTPANLKSAFARSLEAAEDRTANCLQQRLRLQFVVIAALLRVAT